MNIQFEEAKRCNCKPGQACRECTYGCNSPVSIEWIVSTNSQDRIATALERIATALENRNEQL